MMKHYDQIHLTKGFISSYGFVVHRLGKVEQELKAVSLKQKLLCWSWWKCAASWLVLLLSLISYMLQYH